MRKTKKDGQPKTFAQCSKVHNRLESCVTRPDLLTLCFLRVPKSCAASWEPAHTHKHTVSQLEA